MAEAEQNLQAIEDDVRSHVKEGREYGLTDSEIAEGIEITVDELLRIMDESICRVCGNHRLTDIDFGELTRQDKSEEGGTMGDLTLTMGDAMNWLRRGSLAPTIFATLVSFLRDCGIPERVIRENTGLSDDEFEERMGN